MEVILYNPKSFNGKPGQPVPNLKNPDGTLRYIVLPSGMKAEPIQVNELKKYPEEVANEIVKTWSFIRKVDPKDLASVKEEMTSKALKCEFCEYATDDEKRLKMHKTGKHKLSNEALEEINAIKSADVIEAKPTINKNYSPEGIPNDDSEGWVGPGEETLTQMKPVRPGMSGVFGG